MHPREKREQLGAYDSPGIPERLIGRAEEVRAISEHARHQAYDWLVRCPGNSRLITLVSSPMEPQYCPVCGQPANDVQKASV
jgi:hypothetical protein